MKISNLYYRKKGSSIIIERKEDGRTVYIKTLPKPETLLELIMPEASYFNEEKMPKKGTNSKASKGLEQDGSKILPISAHNNSYANTENGRLKDDYEDEDEEDDEDDDE